MGVGIDEGAAPDTHLITAQIAKASALKSSTGEGGGGGGGKAYVNVQYEAKSIFSGVQGLMYKTSRDMYFSHNQVILVGRAVAQRDITATLDFFVRDYEGRLNTLLAVADGKAEDTLDEETELEKLPAVQLNNVLKMQRINSTSAVIDLRQFLIANLSKTTAPTAPIVELYKDKQGKTKARVGNTAVFKNGKMIGELDKTQARGMLWVTGGVRGGALDTKALDGLITFELRQSSSSIEPVLKEGGFSIKIKINQKCSIAEAETKENLMKVENADKMAATAQSAILEEVYAAVNRAKALNADVFGFGEAIRRKYPVQSKQMLENWDDEFPQLAVDISVTASVLSTGSVTLPITPGGK